MGDLVSLGSCSKFQDGRPHFHTWNLVVGSCLPGELVKADKCGMGWYHSDFFSI